MTNHVCAIAATADNFNYDLSCVVPPNRHLSTWPDSQIIQPTYGETTTAQSWGTGMVSLSTSKQNVKLQKTAI